jgi:hypothetical protein
MDCKGLLLPSICAPFQRLVVAKDSPAHCIAGSDQQVFLIEVYELMLGLQAQLLHDIT